ncbi:sensor histidine kinase [Actinomadura barringtoniae]|uniref:histidine kinase n=2 Tax=Actinomadura barringtoniae TaxID=1427535 RepID=A0A939T6B0_9ACTN|nr:sensor histidine kinase [Actinomadura barringtoniae]
MSELSVRSSDRPMWPAGGLLITACCLVLVVRRRHPVITLWATIITAVVYYSMGFPDGPIGLAFVIALYTAAVECRLFVSLAATAAINAGFVLMNLWRGTGGNTTAEQLAGAESVAGVTFFLLPVIALGQYVRNRRQHIAAIEERAAEAERTREQEALRRAAEERLRIARELHDVLAHQISLINVQAGAALHRRDDPERAYASLEAIKRASKDTLRELRGVLGVLRQVDEQDGGPPVAPAPSLSRVGELLEQTSAAGLKATLSGPPPAVDLPAPVDLAGYRIVQEALTNAVRHAAASTATVQIRCTTEAVIVQIDDDGVGPTPAGSAGGPGGSVESGGAADAAEQGEAGGGGSGNGLRGMAERAASVGGEMTAGPGPGGGFRVWARLPLPHPGERTEEIGQ